MKRLAFLALFAASSCAAASGYDPKRYADAGVVAPDPDTVALAPTARGTIADPKRPPAPPAPVPAPPPPPPEDAGAPDAAPPYAAPKPRPPKKR